MFILALLIAFGFSFYVHRHEVSSEYCYYGDVTGYYIIDAFNDSASYPKDYMYQSAANDPMFFFRTTPFCKLLLPIEIRLIKLMGLQFLLAWKSILLFTVALLLIYRIGCHQLDDKKSLFLMSLACFFIASMDTFYGGLIRALGFIIVLLIYDLFRQRNIKGLILLVPVMYLFYPPAVTFAVVSAFIGAYAFNHDLKSRLKNMLQVSFVTVIVAVTIYVVDSPLFSYAYNKDNNEFFYRWKTEQFSDIEPIIYYLHKYILNTTEHHPLYVYLINAFLISALALWIIGKLRKKTVFLEGEKLFIISAISSFIVLLPIGQGIASRQLMLTIPIFLLVFNWRQVFKFVPNPFSFFYVVLISLSVILITNEKMSVDIVDNRHIERTAEYVKKLPGDSFILTHPLTGSTVTFNCRKSAFIDDMWRELSALLKDGRKTVNKKIETAMNVLYAESLSDVAAFCDEKGITHIWLDEEYYSDNYLNDELIHWGEMPYKGMAQNIARRSNYTRTDFPLIKYAREKGLQFDEGHYIIQCRALKEGVVVKEKVLP
jgi:hypothetical protein